MTSADFIYLSSFKQYGLFCFSIIVSSDIQNVVIVWCSCRDSNSENLVFETNAYAISATGTRNTDSSILNMLVLKLKRAVAITLQPFNQSEVIQLNFRRLIFCFCF